MVDSSHRIVWAQMVFLGVFLALLMRLGYWQIWKHQELSAIAQQQYDSLQEIPPERGLILDRNDYVLAGNEEVYTLFAQPHLLKESPESIATKLAPLLIDPTASDAAQQQLMWQQTISGRLSSDRKWVSLATGLNREQEEKIKNLKIFTLGFDPIMDRRYPDASVSAHLLGFVGKDDQGQDQGYFGVEGYYDRELRGRPGKQEIQRSASGLPLLAASTLHETQPEEGRNLRLTIDKGLQQSLEMLLADGVSKYSADSGEVVVMDPNTGDVLALAAVPTYDPRNFADADPSLYRNPVVSDLYEPGSTLKVLTVAAAVEAGVANAETTCPVCGGPRVISGFSIRTWNEAYNPNISVRDALAKSDNTAMVYLQDLLGKQRTLQWWEKFGLNVSTGVDLQGEVKPVWRSDRDWREIDVATSSFGQGIAITSLQLVRSVSSLANGGYLVRPRVVSALQTGSDWQTVPVQKGEKILSDETLRAVNEMMVYSAQQGDSKWTASRIVNVAGKTGTAQIAEGGTYLEDQTIASFVGFAPAEKPEFVMLVKLRYPKTSPWGSETAAPLWYKMMPIVLQATNRLAETAR